MDKQKLYTIGYTLFSGRNGIDTDKMFETLRIYKVSYLADVRSIPFSKQYPQCNSNCLKSIGTRFSVQNSKSKSQRRWSNDHRRDPRTD